MNLRRFCTLLLLGFLATSSIGVLQAQQPSVGTFDFEQAREPLVKLDGLWRFHPGDNPRWAEPGFDDSGWAAIRGDKNWGDQGYKGLGGYAWYRARVVLPAGTKPLALYIPSIFTHYQVFADGTRLQGCGAGRMDKWTDVRPVVCDLPQQTSGAARTVTLAVRVWHWPYVAPISGGGIQNNILIGERRFVESRWLAGVQSKSWNRVGGIVVATLTLLSSVAALLLFLFRRDQREYLWFGIMSALDATMQMTSIHDAFYSYAGMWHTVRSDLVSGVDGIATILFYFYFLRARRNWLFWLAIAGSVSTIALGPVQAGELVGLRVLLVLMAVTVLPSFVWIWGLIMRRAIAGDVDARLIIGPVLLPYAQMLILVVLWFLYLSGLHLSQPTWLNATASWPFPFNFQNLMQALFLIAMLAILIYRFSRSSAQEQRLASELAAAQAVQSIMIPEEIPKLPGFAIESVYRPASQVGGDFFQILPTRSGGVLAVIGDVSGKGMPAAMIVSLLVGTVRTLAESTDSPAEILEGLNRRLVGRSSGFTTCLILRADPDGTCVVANAGHLPPYVNGREVEVGAGLVLGISAEASYEETVLHLEESARLTLLTDGVVEARSRTGELYGFERAAAMAGAPAAEIAAEAQAFGQEDDITVVSVTRAVALEAAMV